MATTNSTLTIRELGHADAAAVERVAALDSRRPPRAPLVGAEVEGRLLAAVSIETGDAVADPFSRTAELTSLLQMRAAQMRGRKANVIGGTRPTGASRPVGIGQLAGLHPRAS
jgi:hypothetical protein